MLTEHYLTRAVYDQERVSPVRRKIYVVVM